MPRKIINLDADESDNGLLAAQLHALTLTVAAAAKVKPYVVKMALSEKTRPGSKAVIGFYEVVQEGDK